MVTCFPSQRAIWSMGTTGGRPLFIPPGGTETGATSLMGFLPLSGPLPGGGALFEVRRLVLLAANLHPPRRFRGRAGEFPDQVLPGDYAVKGKAVVIPGPARVMEMRHRHAALQQTQGLLRVAVELGMARVQAYLHVLQMGMPAEF